MTRVRSSPRPRKRSKLKRRSPRRCSRLMYMRTMMRALASKYRRILLTPSPNLPSRRLSNSKRPQMTQRQRTNNKLLCRKISNNRRLSQRKRPSQRKRLNQKKRPSQSRRKSPRKLLNQKRKPSPRRSPKPRKKRKPKSKKKRSNQRRRVSQLQNLLSQRKKINKLTSSSCLNQTKINRRL